MISFMRPKSSILLLFTFIAFKGHSLHYFQADSTVLANEQMLVAKADSLKYLNQFNESLLLWEQLYSGSSVSKTTKLRAINETADVYRALKDTDKAKKRLDEARNLLKGADADQKSMGMNRLYWGKYFTDAKNADSALYNFQRAAFLAEKSEDTTLFFLSLNELGNYYHETVHNDLAAVYYYNKGLQLSEAGMVNIPIVAARTSYTLALTAKGLNEKEKAIDYSKEALGLLDSLPVEVHFDFVANVEYLLATLYVALQEHDEAIPHLKKAIALRQKYQPEDTSYLSDFYYPALSVGYETNGSIDSAIMVENQRMLLLPDSLLGDGADINFRLSELLLRKGDLVQAKKLIDAYATFYGVDSVAGTQERFRSLLLKGEYFTAASSADSALFYFSRALATIAPQLTFESVAGEAAVGKIPPQQMPRAVLAMGKIAEALTQFAAGDNQIDQLNTALQLFESTLEYARYGAVENLLEDYPDSDRLINFHRLTEKSLETIYRLYAVTNDQAYLSKAFGRMENDKLFIIRQEAAEAMFLNNAALPDSAKVTFAALNREILARIDDLDLAINDEEKHDRENNLIESFGKMIKWREKSQTYLKATHAEYHLFDNVSFSDLHDHSNIHLIEYFYGEKNLYAISVSDSSKVLIQRSVNQDLEEEIHAFLKHFWATPKMYSQEDLDHFVEVSSVLYKDLVEPLMPELPSRRGIVIVPDGLIKLLPFETLLTYRPSMPSGYHELPYLVHSASVSYVSSAEMLVDLPDALPKLNSKLISFALRSGIDGEDPVSRYIVSEMKNSRLYFEGMSFRGVQATKDAFIRMAPKFEILYLLIHGDAIDYPKLIFNKGRGASVERNLYTHEIYNLNLPGNLIVLSSTESGMGLIPHGEAVLSMVRAFLSAGGGAVIMGLWEAHDEHSKNIISAFFRKMALGENSQEALRNSKLDFLAKADRLAAHPHNWAELISYGEPVAVTMKKDEGMLKWIVIILSIFLLGTYLVAMREKYIDRLIEEEERNEKLKGAE